MKRDRDTTRGTTYPQSTAQCTRKQGYKDIKVRLRPIDSDVASILDTVENKSQHVRDAIREKERHDLLQAQFAAQSEELARIRAENAELKQMISALQMQVAQLTAAVLAMSSNGSEHNGSGYHEPIHRVKRPTVERLPEPIQADSLVDSPMTAQAALESATAAFVGMFG